MWEYGLPATCKPERPATRGLTYDATGGLGLCFCHNDESGQRLEIISTTLGYTLMSQLPSKQGCGIIDLVSSV